MRSRYGNSRYGRTIAAVLAVALAVLLGACGVPSSGPPVLDGNAPRQGNGVGAGGRPLPPGPAPADSATDLVAKYLEAVAGQTDADSPTATTVLKAFMTDPVYNTFHPSKTVTVVHQLGELSTSADGDATRIDGEYQVLGQLRLSDGALLPPPPGTQNPTTLTFRASIPKHPGDAAPGLRFVDVPTDVYMSDTALVDYYTAHSIYFWDASNSVLVPELRYVPQTVSQVQAQTIIVNWVLAGPSDALGQAVTRTVASSMADPQVLDSNGRIMVNLSATSKLSANDQQALGDQLRWSLLGMGTKPEIDPPVVDILVAGQQQLLVDDETKLRKDNPASSRLPRPPEYAIGRNGVVRPVDSGPTALLTSQYNTGVRMAAVNEDQTSAALVREGRNGDVELWVRRGADKAHDFVRVLTGQSMSRPVWLTSVDDNLAVVVDGKLMFVNAHNKLVTPTTNGIPPIKAISFAPDDRRIALVSTDGHLYTTLVTWSSQTPPSLQAARQLQPVFSPAISQIDAVAWSKTDQLAVGATRSDDRYQLFEVNSDGANTTTLSEGLVAAITQIAAYPMDTYLRDGRVRNDIGPIVFQTTSEARRVLPAEGTEPMEWSYKVAGDNTKPTSPFFPD